MQKKCNVIHLPQNQRFFLIKQEGHSISTQTQTPKTQIFFPWQFPGGFTGEGGGRGVIGPGGEGGGGLTGFGGVGLEVQHLWFWKCVQNHSKVKIFPLTICHFLNTQTGQ